LGENWLQTSQGFLARIHHEDGSGLSSDSSGEFAVFIWRSQRLRRHDQGYSLLILEVVNNNAQSPLHVEARTHLQPAIDFFSRAVIAAEGSNSLSGELLSSVGTAFEPYL
jgi:hypothetical protein